MRSWRLSWRWSKAYVGNIQGLDKNLPRNTSSLIWGYHYRFRRGYNPIGKNQDTYYNLELKHVPFFWTCILLLLSALCGAISHSIVQSSSFVFWEVRFSWGLPPPTSFLCLKLRPNIWWCLWLLQVAARTPPGRIYVGGFLHMLPPGNPYENPCGLFLYGLFTYIDLHSYIVFSISVSNLKEFGMFGESLWDLC